MVPFWCWNNKRRQSERENERAEDLKLKPRFNENNFKAFGIIFRGNRLQRAKNVAVILAAIKYSPSITFLVLWTREEVAVSALLP